MTVAWTIAMMSIKEEWQRKLPLVLERALAFLMSVVFLSVWTRLTATGDVAGFSQNEFFMYTLLAHIFRPIVFLFKYRVMANEIIDGTFASVLTQPIAVSWYYYWRSWGERGLAFSAACIEVLLLKALFDVQWLWPESFTAGMLFVGLLLAAHVLTEILAFLMNTVAFWTTQSGGPRFLYDWIAEFMGGLYFPLWLLGPMAWSIFAVLPFVHFMYLPHYVWLRGALPTVGLAVGLGAWFVISLSLARSLYRKGLREYTGAGL